MEFTAAGEVGSDLSNPIQSKNQGSKIVSSNTVSPEADVTFSNKDEIIQGKHTLDNAIQECIETKEKGAEKRSSLLKTESFIRGGDKRSPLLDAGDTDESQGKKEFTKNRPVSTSAPDSLQEKKFLGTEVENSSVRETLAASTKSKDKQQSNLPPRSSKRLAGIEPDQGVNLALGERALKAEVLKSRKTETIQDASLTSDGLLDGASAKIETRPGTEVADHASTNTNDSLHGDPSKKSMKPLEDQAAPEELHLNLETEKVNENPEPPLSFLFGSDPCLEFAFKTLLGELPLDDAPLEGPILTQSGDKLQDDLLESKIEKSSTGRGWGSRNKSKSKSPAGALPVDDAPVEVPFLTQAGNTLQDDLLERETKRSSTSRGRVSRDKSKSKTPSGELPLDYASPDGSILTQAGASLQDDFLSETKKGSTGRGRVSRNKSKSKTPSGELPLDDSPLNVPILSQAGSRLQDDLLESETKKSSSGSGRVSKNKSKKKKEVNVPRRSSKRLAGVEPELMANSVVSERALLSASRKPDDKTPISSTNLLDEANEPVVAEPKTELQTQLSNTDTSMQAEPLNIREKSFEDLAAPEEQQGVAVPEEQQGLAVPEEQQGLAVEQQSLAAPQEQQQMNETLKEALEKPSEPNLSFSFLDYWSDPCLDFAFKTLTGIIPIDDSFVQGDIQSQVDLSQNHRNGSLALPDFGSPSLFQTDISSQFDTPEKSVVGQQPSVTSTFVPAGSVNFPSCSGIHSQQQCLEGNKDLHQKVKS